MIPKIIWQTHEWEYNDLPSIYKKTSKTWQTLNPDWEYRYASQKERRSMIESVNPDFVKQYDSLTENRGMMEADLWRLLMVYEYGGVYADMDSVCLASLNEINEIYPDKEMIVTSPFITYAGNDIELLDQIVQNKIEYGYHVNNANFAAQPKNNVLAGVIESIKEHPGWINSKQSEAVLKNFKSVAYDFRWSRHSNMFSH